MISMLALLGVLLAGLGAWVGAFAAIAGFAAGILLFPIVFWLSFRRYRKNSPRDGRPRR